MLNENILLFFYRNLLFLILFIRYWFHSCVLICFKFMSLNDSLKELRVVRWESKIEKNLIILKNVPGCVSVLMVDNKTK